MRKHTLLSSSAIALILLTAPAVAQMQDKGGGGPAAQQERGGGAQAQPDRGGDAVQQRSPQQAPEGRGQAPDKGKRSEGQANSKAQGQNRAEKGEQGRAEKGEKRAQPSVQPEKSNRGTAQKSPATEPKKGAERETPAGKRAADTPRTGDHNAGRENAQKGEAGRQEPKERVGANPEGKNAPRVQVSEQQRTNVHRSVFKENRVNRVTNVNFNISIGTRVPRSLHLVALPPTVIAIVPEYRRYNYFVVDDRICIVEPTTYEIVDVITTTSQTAQPAAPQGGVRLVLSDDERQIIMRTVVVRSDSTLGLGALSEGAEIPAGVEVQTFPAAVVEQVPKVKGYKYFSAENGIAIVDPQGTHVEVVISK